MDAAVRPDRRGEGPDPPSRLDRTVARRDVDLRDGQAFRRHGHASAGDRQADEGERLMARIIGGIGASHAPSMEHVYDKGDEVRRNAEWEPLFGPFEQVSKWLEELDPDRLLVIYNDHMDEFFLDAYPTFALGGAESYPVADEGFG